MKRIGPGGAREVIERTLLVRISVEADRQGHLLRTTPVLLPDPVYEITFELIQLVNGILEVSDLVVKMSARYRGDDNRLREELLASKYRESFGVSSESHLWHESTEPVKLCVSDPAGVMPWLFPDMDLEQFFNQSTEQNDKPLRLTQGDPGASGRRGS